MQPRKMARFRLTVSGKDYAEKCAVGSLHWITMHSTPSTPNWNWATVLPACNLTVMELHRQVLPGLGGHDATQIIYNSYDRRRRRPSSWSIHKSIFSKCFCIRFSLHIPLEHVTTVRRFEETWKSWSPKVDRFLESLPLQKSFSQSSWSYMPSLEFSYNWKIKTNEEVDKNLTFRVSHE